MTGYMPAPTPGTNNGVGTLGFVGDTQFSVDRGFFDAPFQVAITTDTPAATIRYTLDGTPPSETVGTLYTGPITIGTTTTLRAIAYKPGFTSTNVDTQTYIFSPTSIQQTDEQPAAVRRGRRVGPRQRRCRHRPRRSGLGHGSGYRQ